MGKAFNFWKDIGSELEDGSIEIRSAPDLKSKKPRKKSVIHSEIEFKKLTVEAFSKMINNGETFPISFKSLKVSTYFNEAQKSLFTSDRHATFGSHNRKKFITLLNCCSAAGLRPPEHKAPSMLWSPLGGLRPAGSLPGLADCVVWERFNVPVKQVPIQQAPDLSPSLAKAIIEIASIVREHLSKDKEAMQLFTTTLLRLDGLIK